MPAESIKLSSAATRHFWEIPVLYEDAHLLALEKPSGLLTSPDRHDPNRPSLMKLLHSAIAEQKPWARQRGLTYLAHAHRLDLETSGVILLARSNEILAALANLFGSERVKERYVALLQGTPEKEAFEIDAKLAPHPAMPHLVRIDRQRGKKSRTAFTVLEKFRGWTLLQCQPFAARTHQIRVHLRSAGLAIVGDSLYGGHPLRLSRIKPGYRPKASEPERPLISRLALHAEELAFEHPATRDPIAIRSPWPRELEVGLKYLRRYAA